MSSPTPPNMAAERGTLPGLQLHEAKVALLQMMHMIWHGPAPLLNIMVRYMFEATGEPPPDVGARALVRLHSPSVEGCFS